MASVQKGVIGVTVCLCLSTLVVAGMGVCNEKTWWPATNVVCIRSAHFNSSESDWLFGRGSKGAEATV